LEEVEDRQQESEAARPRPTPPIRWRPRHRRVEGHLRHRDRWARL